MSSLNKAARGGGAAQGVMGYIDKRRKHEAIQAGKDMTPMMKLQMQENRIGTFTRNIRDITTQIVVGEDGKRKAQWRPEFLTQSSRGPEPGAPDFLKMSNLIFQQALNANLLPEEYKSFVEAYGKTYEIPQTITKMMLNNKFLGAMVERYTKTMTRGMNSISENSKNQMEIDGAVTEANRGMVQSFTTLGPTEDDKLAAMIQANLSGSAPPTFSEKSRSDTDILVQLQYIADDPNDPRSVSANNALNTITELKRSGSLTGGTRTGNYPGQLYGSKPTAGERGEVRSQAQLLKVIDDALTLVKPEHLQVGHQTGLNASRVANRLRDVKLLNVPVGEWASGTLDYVADTLGVPKEEAAQLRQEFQPVLSASTLVRTAFRKAWTGVAFRKEEMEDYEQALTQMKKDDYPTFVSKLQYLRDFMEDSQLRLVAMMMNGHLTRDQIKNRRVPEEVFYSTKYYITPWTETQGIPGRTEGLDRYNNPELNKARQWLETQGYQSPAQYLDSIDAMPTEEAEPTASEVLKGLDLGFGTGEGEE